MIYKEKYLCPAALAMSLAMYAGSAAADHGSLGFGIGTAAPIITQTGVSLPKGLWAAGLLIQYVDVDSASNQKLLSVKNNAIDDAHGDVHSIDSLFQPSVFAAYGITDDFTLGLRVPYVLRSGIRSPSEEGTEVIKQGDIGNLGDVSVFAQYRVFHTANNQNHLSFLASLKTPTGATHEKTDQGEVAEAHFQPGSGSWDPSFGLAYTRTMGQFSFDSNVLYTIATDGTQNTNLGDAFDYNLALSYGFGAPVRNTFFASSNSAPWTLILELNGTWRDKQSINGATEPNEGGNVIYISPGVRFSGGKGWNTALSVGAPVETDLNGFQTPPDYRVVFRFVAAF